jgi:hypothetical protein
LNTIALPLVLLLHDRAGQQRTAPGATAENFRIIAKKVPLNSVLGPRPMHSVPGPINVRCYSNSDIIVRRSEVTLRAKKEKSPVAHQ